MSSVYLYADETSRQILSNDQQKIILIGGDFGYGNFGDVLQHINCLNIAEQSNRFATVSVLAANSIGFQDFPAWAMQNYGADALIFVADYPLILDQSSPHLELLGEVRNLSVVHLYGGGFLNNMWGDFVLGVAEHFLRLAPHATYLVSGQQVTHPYQSRVLRHIEEFKPALFGVRDALSLQLLRDGGFDPQFSFDDATESLIELSNKLPVERGSGLFMHLNVSDYAANDESLKGLGNDLSRLSASTGAYTEVTLFQAFRDSRQGVLDSREALKSLDFRFPFSDLRLIELVPFVYSEEGQQITRPLLGEFGYSCSYHVALWLQLAGIPCWLRSNNPFYDQKSRALQVTQDLESFLKEPRLADHQSNLEQRSLWRAEFEKVIEGAPEVRQVCQIPQNDSSLAPWPFFFKGKPTVEEKLELATKESDYWRSRVKTAEEQLVQAQEDAQQMNGRIEGLTTQLTEVGHEVHSIRQGAESSQRQPSLYGVVRRVGRLLPIPTGLKLRIKKLMVKFGSQDGCG